MGLVQAIIEDMADLPEKATEKVADELPNIRTYKHDVADTLRQEDVSVATVAIQEQARRYRKEEVTQKELHTTKILVIVIGLLLFVGAVVLSYVIFLRERPAPETIVITPSLSTPLVPAELQTLFDVKDKSAELIYRELALKVQGAGLKADTLEEVIPVLTIEGQTAPKVLNIEEFFQALGIRPPDRFIRFLDKRYMFGIYTFRSTSAFILMKPTSFGPVFAELLAWETDLAEDFYTLLAGKTLPEGIKLVWSDTVIRNVDARVATDEKGEVMLLYAFLPSKEELIITSSLDTFTEVLLRIQSPRPVNQ